MTQIIPKTDIVEVCHNFELPRSQYKSSHDFLLFLSNYIGWILLFVILVLWKFTRILLWHCFFLQIWLTGKIIHLMVTESQHIYNFTCRNIKCYYCHSFWTGHSCLIDNLLQNALIMGLVSINQKHGLRCCE